MSHSFTSPHDSLFLEIEATRVGTNKEASRQLDDTDINLSAQMTPFRFAVTQVPAPVGRLHFTQLAALATLMGKCDEKTAGFHDHADFHHRIIVYDSVLNIALPGGDRDFGHVVSVSNR